MRPNEVELSDVVNLEEINQLNETIYSIFITLLDDQVAHGEGHGVPGEDRVPTVDVLPTDGETSSRHYC